MVANIAHNTLWMTNHNDSLDLDSIAVANNIAYVTSKATHKIIEYDAKTGSKLSAFGNFRRPNGIAIIDNYLFVVERDSHRVSVLHLPSKRLIGTFAKDDLVKPYGITGFKRGETIHLYITDDYKNASIKVDKHSIHYYRISISKTAINIISSKSFGNLEKVESILADTKMRRLLVCDEKRRHIVLFSLTGDFMRIIGEKAFKGDPEGIDVYGDHYIFTDQSYKNNRFLIYDRDSLRFKKAFSLKGVKNTDGIAVHKDILYAIHDDGSLASASLKNAI